MPIETRELPVKLNDNEVLQRADEAAKTTREMYAAEEHRKEVGKELKGKVDELQEKLKRLARVVETKTEDRPIEVQWERDDGRMMMSLVRLDTGEIVQARPMDQEELAARQHDLFAVPTGRKKPSSS